MGLDPQDPAVRAPDSRHVPPNTRGRSCPSLEGPGARSEPTTQQCHRRGDTGCLPEAIRDGQGFEPGDRGVLVPGLRAAASGRGSSRHAAAPWVNRTPSVNRTSCSSGGPRLRKAGTRKLATELDTGSFCSREVLFQEGRRWAFCLQKWSTLATPERTREREIHAAFSEPRAAPAPFEDVTPGEAVT